MHITTHIDISLRVIIYLAINNGELATISEIAEKPNLSRNHLVKVA